MAGDMGMVQGGSLNSLPRDTCPEDVMTSWKCKDPGLSTSWTEVQAMQPRLGLKVLVGNMQDLELSTG